MAGADKSADAACGIEKAAGEYTFLVCNDLLEVLQVAKARSPFGVTVIEPCCPSKTVVANSQRAGAKRRRLGGKRPSGK